MVYGKTDSRMNILAIETSLPTASLCLYADGEFRYSSDWTAERNHDAALFPALKQALDTLGDAPLDLILVGAGPGSYGGIRVALAAAVGIATVKNARIASICSWENLAPEGCCMVSDARRGGWTLRRPNGELMVLTAEQLISEAENGANIATVESAETLSKLGITAVAAGLIPTAQSITQAWNALSETKQEQLLQTPPEPIYVRPPHITEAKRKPWEV